ncbi:MAG TPA: YHS domain-containing protein [Candidatus Tectomicrobia bacterium]|nr:YHS domain-containing protein [Candidatus Tectomicrobia bacterium]
MANDPVCGMAVDKQRATSKREYLGRTYYFCSTGCQRRFEEDPTRYADPRSAQQDATRQLTVQPGEDRPCVP